MTYINVDEFKENYFMHLNKAPIIFIQCQRALDFFSIFFKSSVFDNIDIVFKSLSLCEVLETLCTVERFMVLDTYWGESSHINFNIHFQNWILYLKVFFTFNVIAI